MSGLPPKADICSALTHVRLGPIAGISGAIDARGNIKFFPRSSSSQRSRRQH